MFWVLILVTQKANTPRQEKNHFESLSVNELVLKDSKQRVRMRMRTRANDEVEYIVRNTNNEIIFHLLSDPNNVDLVIGARENRILLRSTKGHAEVSLLNRNSVPGLRILRDGDSSSIVMLDQTEQPTLGLMGNPQQRQFLMFDDRGQPRVGLGLDSEGPQFVLQDSNQIPRLGISLLNDAAQVLFRDANAISRGVIQQEGDSLTAQLNDAYGKSDALIRVGGADTSTEVAAPLNMRSRNQFVNERN